MKINEINFTDSIQTALSGDMRGFEFIYNQTYRYYRAMVTKYFPNREEADDLLQDIYLRLYENLGTIKDTEKFFPWSKVLVQNMIKNELQHRAGKMLSNTEYRPMYASEEEGSSLEDISLTDYEREYNRKSFLEEYNPELSAENLERKEILDEMLNALPQMQRTCILLWQEGYSTKEMAETLNIPSGTVLSNINYAKKKIKANVLALEKKGTKLYGMAPLTFFLWVLEQFDLLDADTQPPKGDELLWEQISKSCNQLMEQTVNASSEVLSQKLSTEVAETVAETTSVSGKDAVSLETSKQEATSIVKKGADSTHKRRIIQTGYPFSARMIISVLLVVMVGIMGYVTSQQETLPAASVEVETKKEKPDEKQRPKKETASEHPDTTKEEAENPQEVTSEEPKGNAEDDKKERDNQKQEDSSKPSKSNHTHNYNIPITKTVKHDATGHYENKWVQDSAAWDEPIYATKVVCGCGAQFDSASAWNQHSIDGCNYGYSVKEVQVGTKHHEATGHNEKVWVQDKAAWTETVTTGYKCSCGATR